MAEFETDFYPEFGRAAEPIVNADGSEESAEAVLRAAYADLK
jgi:tellurite resistance protein